MRGSSATALGPAGVREGNSILLLLWVAAHFLVLGVFGEFDTFAINFAPLAVFLSSHITLSQPGDDETVRARFPRIGGGIKVGQRRVWGLT